ncbi:Signal transduction histidine kinase [Mucilaginibacter sp. OK268]|uniref:tetratricopeptide repeat-containing sensor histidine kinase n=1 Tax=Mucilaginibacter sp. OK268 TaxID=1881048 RepID=UPI0008808217|nr:tetratricopeptide repeat-containing sensor histidine kinase [Mucilaginibacter sp. OK268]SDP94627.1 Signal transduction histidine kinase [Mucilaginibacter sp. OK268]
MPLPLCLYPAKLVKWSCLGLLLTCVLFLSACKQVSTKNINHPALADSIIDKTNTLLNSGQLERSVISLDSAYRGFPNPGVTDLWKKYNQKANYYLYYDKNPVKERLYADSMLLILKGKELQYKTEYAGAVFAKGDVLIVEKRYAEAFKCYYDGKIFGEKNLDSCSYCQLTYQLGMVRYIQGNYLRAIPYFKQAFTENSHCKAGAGFSNLFIYPQSHLNTIALCFERANMPDSAIYYYKRALTFINRNAGRFPEKKQFAEMARAVVYGNLGGVYALVNNYTEAEKYLQESIHINNRQGYAVEDAQTAQLKLAGLYVQFSRFTAADSLLKQIELDLLAGRGKSQSNADNRLKWKKLKWKYYDKTHQVALAYQYIQQYDNMRDSLDEVSKGLKIADIDQGFKNIEQQYRLTLLSKNDELKTAYLAAIIVFSVMTIIILLLVWYNLRRYRNSVNELTKLNQKISEYNTQMQKTLTALEQSQEENTRMMKMVAHDLRNPVGAMMTVATMMLDNKRGLGDDRTMLELIKTSGKNSLNLIDDLLQIHTRLEELKMEPVDMFTLLHYCVELLYFKAEAKGQQIQLTADHLTISVNREKMWRVISNLIANAIKFSPSGAIVNVQMISKEDSVLITIEDHGIGIPAEMHDRVFDMFTEAKRPGTAGEQPFGMGLAISKQIVEAHGGHIWFESKQNNGTFFYVELPLNN